ncbi:MAG: enoyl-CoA hydratase [Candidatus Tectimicrobiota bacterium]|nr:MAG: enoyl-CoA hydratase [Candidatus Tectomicrobia bacterium]
MAFHKLRYEVADGVATVTLNRPERLNALDYALRDELLAALQQAAADPQVRALILTGAGRAFCAGADLHDVLVRGFDMDPRTREQEEVRGFNALTQALRALEKPVIAAVNGAAVGGGCCLALAADIRLASSEARFGMVFVRLGLSSADMGGTFLLPRLIGLAHASELLLTGEIIDAARAERLGLVNRVVAPEELLPQARQLAARLAAGPPIGLALTKRAINRALGLELAAHLDYEAYVQSACMLTADHREGVEAFLQKRAPQFRGG